MFIYTKKDIANNKIVVLNKNEYHTFKKNKKYSLDKDYFYEHIRNEFGRFCGCSYYRLNDWELGREDREKRADELYQLLKDENLIPSTTKKKKI